MSIKYFQALPRWIVGLILIIASMIDGISITAVIENHQTLAVLLIAVRAGFRKFDELYNQGHISSNITKQ